MATIVESGSISLWLDRYNPGGQNGNSPMKYKKIDNL